MSPPPGPAAPPKRRGRGCLVGVVLLGLFFWLFVRALNAPRLAAEEFKGRLRVGMTLADVVVASFGTSRHFVFVRGPETSAPLQVSGSTVTVASERAEGESAARALLERKAAELRVDSLSVMFLSTVPVRSSIVVRFGPDGRVQAIEGPVDWAS